MGRLQRIAVLVLAALWLAGPALAFAADCAGCCCPPAPCHESEAGCGETLAKAGCCDEAPDALPSPLAKRASESAPALDAPLRTRAILEAGDLAALRCPAVGPRDLAARASPLRLSVVLLI